MGVALNKLINNQVMFSAIPLRGVSSSLALILTPSLKGWREASARARRTGCHHVSYRILWPGPVGG